MLNHSHSCFHFSAHPQVHTNGYISLNPVKDLYAPQLFPGSSGRIIAPFLADVDTVCKGQVSWTVRTSGHELWQVQREINNDSFTPSFLLIVTWENVGYHLNSFNCDESNKVVWLNITKHSYISLEYFPCCGRRQPNAYIKVFLCWKGNQIL